jgi:hypothetical protein
MLLMEDPIPLLMHHRQKLAVHGQEDPSANAKHQQIPQAQYCK